MRRFKDETFDFITYFIFNETLNELFYISQNTSIISGNTWYIGTVGGFEINPILYLLYLYLLKQANTLHIFYILNNQLISTSEFKLRII